MQLCARVCVLQVVINTVSKVVIGPETKHVRNRIVAYLFQWVMIYILLFLLKLVGYSFFPSMVVFF